ncbi:MAG: DNA polymerase III subunit delta' [Clostridiales bacterium]|nr:DNA polymerase III subunit delta' [Clostridiales bacterium]
MQSFHDIVGHDQIKAHFQNAIKYHKVSHAYILAGEAGMGKKSLANAFSLALLCERGGTEPCMQCHACKQVLSGSHPDLIHVTHEKPNSIGVDDIRRQINDSIVVRPYNNGYKIYIVDEAEKMTQQAQNALLKTIEEPPPYAVILLLSANPDLFLPTILSRCVQLKLKPLRDSVVRDYLTEKLGIPEVDAEIFATFARGNLGKAIALSSSDEFKHMANEVLGILRHVKEADISDLLEDIRRMKEDKLDIHECLEFMQLWYRDILLYKVTRDINQLIFKDEFRLINEISKNSGYDGLERILEAIEKAKVRLDANVNMELAMELMLLVMKEN